MLMSQNVGDYANGVTHSQWSLNLPVMTAGPRERAAVKQHNAVSTDEHKQRHIALQSLETPLATVFAVGCFNTEYFSRAGQCLQQFSERKSYSGLNARLMLQPSRGMAHRWHTKTVKPIAKGASTCRHVLSHKSILQ